MPPSLGLQVRMIIYQLYVWLAYQPVAQHGRALLALSMTLVWPLPTRIILAESLRRERSIVTLDGSPSEFAGNFHWPTIKPL